MSDARRTQDLFSRRRHDLFLVLYEELLMFHLGNNRLEIQVYLTFLVLIHLFVN